MFDLILLLTCQAPAALASTSSDSSLPQDPVVADEDWIRREEGAPGALYFPAQSQMAILGDLDGDGVFEAPSDVDALAFVPSAASPTLFDVLYSPLTGVGGFEDGDLLRILTGGGVAVEVGEAEFLAALQPASGGFDLDAVEWLAPDEIWFSVEGTLLGTVLGDVEDGDVLVLDRGTGLVRREHTEAQIQAFVDQAGGGGAAVGDVLSLAFHPGTGELVFSIQSPSAADATLYGTGAGGRVLPGWAEADWQFQQESELDALTFVPAGMQQPPSLATDAPFYGSGATVRFSVRRGTPGGTLLTYVAGSTRFLAQPGQGAGFFWLNRSDPLLVRQIRHGNNRPQMLDAAGSESFDWIAPAPRAGAAYLDLWFQCLDLASGRWTAPIVVRIQ